MFQQQDREKIREAWNKFQLGKEFDITNIRQEILDSWKRCKQHGVDPYGSMTTLSCKEVEILQKKNKNLISAASNYLNMIYSTISNRGSSVLLSDCNGVCIFLIGDQEIMKKHQELGVGLGTDSSEKAMGTNGIGTCLYLDRTVYVCPEEHYCKVIQMWYCVAAPIHDPQGKLLGCINVSGILQKDDTDSLGMVIGAAKAIERQLRINKMIKEKETIITRQNMILDLISDAILMIDTEGNINHLNKKALQMFNVTKEQVLNTSIDHLILSGIDHKILKETRSKIRDMEIDIALPHKDLSCRLTTEITKDDKGAVENIILTFKENERIHELVNKVTGSMAKYTFEQMCGKSDALKEAIRQGKLAAQINSTVLITGESGTGKELMAQSIHNASQRAHKPFITINCGALPRELIESELFGYVGGAFTGAKKEGNPGKFELADGGTIFLDEIGDMPLDIQVTLLRVLQEQEVTRIGATKPKKIDVKVIAATNKNLKLEIKNKSFRNDLYYRLNVFEICLPPLRERREDVPLLIRNILKRLRGETNKRDLVIDNKALDFLYAYDWPGNIRELENVLERAANFCEGAVITCKELPIFDSSENEKGIVCSRQITEQKGLYFNEAKLIIDTLTDTRGNINVTAERLGVARSTVYRKIKQYGISLQECRNLK